MWGLAADALNTPLRRIEWEIPPALPCPFLHPRLMSKPASCRSPKARPATSLIQLEVDATDTTHKVLPVRMVLPVSAGPLRLHYPRWLPGHHSPYGPIQMLAGLSIQAGSRTLAWTRDPADVCTFGVDIPEGVDTIEITFQALTPVLAKHGRVTITPEILDLQWNLVALYPAGVDASKLQIAASVKLPAGWQCAAALTQTASQRGWVRFAPVSFDTLIDSPLFAGQHFKRIKLHQSGRTAVHLNIVADEDSHLETKPEQIDAHVRMVEEAYALFQSRHYKRYEFLLSLSDKLGGIGLEHHESSENGVDTGYFTEWDKTQWHRDLLPHEYVHSWNGKFRRPAGQCVPDFNTPLENHLLWVYEGQTQYWGQVLAARCGLWSEEFARASLASVAAVFEHKRPGRQWRPLVDTTLQPIVTDRKPLTYVTWQRTEDYYQEGQLLWLDVDTRLRELTDDKRSLDDFAAAFFGVQDGRVERLAYDFNDVVRALNDVAPFRWGPWLRQHVETVRRRAPLDGLARAGWTLEFQDKPSVYTANIEKAMEFADFSYSLGFGVLKDGSLGDVLWGSPAFKANLTSGMKLLAVGGREYKKDLLNKALASAVKSRKPIELLFKQGDRYKTVLVPCTTGPRHPHLVRIDGTPDRLSAILAPKVARAKKRSKA